MKLIKCDRCGFQEVMGTTDSKIKDIAFTVGNTKEIVRDFCPSCTQDVRVFLSEKVEDPLLNVKVGIQIP